MTDRWDDPPRRTEQPGDDDHRDERRSEDIDQGADRDRAERAMEHGDEPGTERSEASTGTLDRAEEQAATADASLWERSQAAARRAGGMAALVLASVTDALGWHKTDDRLAVQVAAAAAETVEAKASADATRREHENAAEEPTTDGKEQEQLPQDREGDRQAVVDPAVDRVPGFDAAGSADLSPDDLDYLADAHRSDAPEDTGRPRDE
ncbi:hypothetical protein KBX50_01050 [Micromonospora sp. C51]|uniref:hypothetical protein n=1 Tax=Micromonospora sp. C51 TaxID=2824879 RepID=UPI001B36A393|nr:hypothetical protein [Micromonospora sp. C51]MBQ1047066.1 hypothetical protein [Micromonospora sp. C51]